MYLFGVYLNIYIVYARDEDPDPNPVGSGDFWLPDPVIFSKDPDPTCNNGLIKLFLS